MTRPTMSLVLVLAVLECLPLAHPQTFPVAEAYLGFTMFNNEYGTDRQNSPGAQLGFGYNLHRNLRLIADFGAETHGTKIAWTNGRNASADSYQLLFGPELTIRSKPNVTPFFHGLVGVAFRNYAVPTGNWDCSIYSCYETSFSIARDTGFATGIGVGIDWHLHSVMSFRVVQFDWVRSHLTRDNANFNPVLGQLPNVSGWQDNYRFSVGIVFRVGQKGGER